MMSVGFGMCLNSVGVFLPFVADALGVTKAAVSFYMTIQGLGLIIGMYIAGRMIPKGNIKLLLSIATIVMAVCFVFMSFGTDLMHWYIIAVPLGISISFIAPLPISILISNWFEKKRGFASGISFAFSGITGAILSPIATNIIQAYGWQTAYRVYAVIALVLMLPTAIFMLVNKPEDMGLLPYGVELGETVVKEGSKVSNVTYGTSLKDALKMPIFFTTIFVAFFLSIGGGFNQQFPSHAVTMGLSPNTGSLLVSICMVIQLIANVPLGILCDKIGVRMAATIYSSIGALGALILSVSGSSPMMYVGCALYGMGICQTMVVSPQVAREIFGKKDYARINSIVMIMFAFAGALCHTVYAGVAAIFGSYSVSLLLAFGFYIISIILVNVSCIGGRKLMEENKKMEGLVITETEGENEEQQLAGGAQIAV
ncbi:MAG: MFS transporter [Lachnospiraceae bacterium]|nr:MFS transporter [Lachnospiraceae bacterium]